MQIFPGKLRQLWNRWELRAMVLLSLSLQMTLIGLGNRRKYNTRNWIRIILWLAYLSADWVATVSLGVLSSSQGDSTDDSQDPNYVIMAFWAPFLLLHLGGPDTITAYSLEDNELWLRHLLGLIVQVSVALYVFVRSFKPTELNFVAIPIFIAGIIKYGERTWVLRSGSSKYFRASLLPCPDPGPNYAKFMEEYVLRETEGFYLSWSMTKAPNIASHNYAANTNSIIPDADILNAAYDFFLIYKRLFADLILSFQDLEKSLSYFRNCSWEDAFKVIEVELGFIYDILYTKATINHSSWGSFLRFTSLFSTAVALIAFSSIDLQRQGYSSVDTSISFLLLVGAIGLELYAFLLMLSSDWMLLRFSKHRNPFVKPMYRVISCFEYIISKRKWCNSMAQNNLISYCLKENPSKCYNSEAGPSILKDFMFDWVPSILKECMFEQVPSILKKFLFERLVKISKCVSDFEVYKQLCAARGDRVLQEHNCLDKLRWSVEVEFDHSILLWHIATNLCYFSDPHDDPAADWQQKCEASKLLSDYMLYILVERPFMLPNGIGQIRFQDTCAEATEFFQESKALLDEYHACKKLLQVDTRIPPEEVKGDRSKSVLFDACKLAKSLQRLEREEQWGKKQKWEMISEVWVEVLSYAASKCTWNHHAQQLGRGGELLTHVWLLMSHLGLTENFQISQGHARIRLTVQ
ncbi:hypothetical protein LguiB_031651 [Lonicera macranthoides]